jgi:hypothetical protein
MWKSVEEKPPKEGRYLLWAHLFEDIHVSNWFRVTGSYVKGEFFPDWDSWLLDLGYVVMCWDYLPEKPKVKE